VSFSSIQVKRRDGTQYTVVFDEADAALVASKAHWRIRVSNGRPYANCGRCRQTPETMHHLFLRAPEGMEVDHINGNSLDNRRANLRIVTKSQNQFNKGAQRNNTSGFKGVIYDKRRGYWRFDIQAHGARRSVGGFASAEAAADGYRAAAEELHGEFACLTASKP
jgi:hypothetical protein